MSGEAAGRRRPVHGRGRFRGGRRVSRRVDLDDLVELLAAVPRASIAFRGRHGIEAMPVAFRYDAARYLIGLPRRSADPLPAGGDVVKLLIDDGHWFFDLRGLWVRGPIVPAEPPGDVDATLSWFEIKLEKAAAWDYGTLRREAAGGS